MIKKKILSLGLACIVLSMSIAGCSGKTAVSDGASNGKTETAKESSKDSGASDTLGSSKKTLENVIHYPDEDERILFGTYENEKKYLSRFGDGTDAEKQALVDEYQSELHFHDVEITSWISTYEYTEVCSLSVEPVQMTFSYATAGGSLYGCLFGDPDFPFYTKKGDNDIRELAFGSLHHQSEIVLKKADEMLYKTLEAAEAVKISQNLRRFCDLHIMDMYFAEEDSNEQRGYYYVYEIEGDTIRYTPMAFNYYTLELQLAPESEWQEMQFGFRGTDLVILKDGEEIVLGAHRQNYYDGEERGYFYLDGTADDETFCGIKSFLISFNHGETHTGSLFAHIDFVDGSYAHDVTADLIGDDEVTVQWEGSDYKDDQGKMNQNPGSVTFKFISAEVADGFTVYDGGKLYYYYSEDESVYSSLLADNLEEGTDISKLNEEEIATIEDNQAIVVSELKEGLSIAGVAANVDEKTGKVTLDNSILFGFDSDELSAEGKAYLDSFIDVYARVMEKQSNDERVSSVKVVGHTDISGSYDYNLDLSERRAKSVVDYCTETHPEIADIIKAEGKSYSEPIYNEDGSVNMEASRRVEFKAMLQY